jgi:hypothetical protein
VELGPPGGDRSWADVRRALLAAGQATLSRAASLQLAGAYLALRDAVRDHLSDRPQVTREQLASLVTEPKQARVRRDADAARRLQHEHAQLRRLQAGRQGKREPPTDDQLRARSDVMALLRAVADGRVVRGAREETSMFARHLLDGEDVRLQLRWLVGWDLIRMPISGPPSLYPRGERLLRSSTET